jgi:hypothetical protein
MVATVDPEFRAIGLCGVAGDAVGPEQYFRRSKFLQAIGSPAS